MNRWRVRFHREQLSDERRSRLYLSERGSGGVGKTGSFPGTVLELEQTRDHQHREMECFPNPLRKDEPGVSHRLVEQCPQSYNGESQSSITARKPGNIPAGQKW